MKKGFFSLVLFMDSLTVEANAFDENMKTHGHKMVMLNSKLRRHVYGRYSIG